MDVDVLLVAVTAFLVFLPLSAIGWKTPFVRLPGGDRLLPVEQPIRVIHCGSSCKIFGKP